MSFMKLFKQLFLASWNRIFAVLSCKKEKSLERSGSDRPLLGIQGFTHRCSKGDMDTAYIQTVGSISSIILEGTSIDNTSDFYLEIFGNKYCNRNL